MAGVVWVELDDEGGHPGSLDLGPGVLVPTRTVRQSRRVERRGLPRPDRTQVRLVVASALCYAVGYPVALAADQPWGWLLVTLGGVLLVGLLFVTVRRIDRGA